MSSTPIILKSSDEGAPQLTGDAGELNAALKWALPQIGWTVEFEDTANNKVAYRNSPTDGLGFYIQVDNSIAAGSSAWDQWATPVIGYQSMTDIDTGAGQFGTGCKIMHVTPYNNSGPTDWFIIGDRKTFYWFCKGRDADKPFAMATYGEFQTFVPDDIYYFIVSSDINGTSSNEAMSDIVYGHGRIAASHDGATAGVAAEHGDMNALWDRGPANEDFNAYFSLGGSFITSDILVCEGQSVRGRRRGILNSSQVWSRGGYSEFDEDIIETPRGPRNCVAIAFTNRPTDSSLNNNEIFYVWFDMEDWD